MNYNIDSLTEDYGYTRTSAFNGLKVKRGRQWFTVAEAALVPRKWDGDKRIIAKVNLVSKQGSTLESGFVYENLHVAII